MKKITLFSLLILFAVASCNKKVEKQAEEDDQLILDYLAAQQITATKAPSGLYYFIEEQGTGPECTSSSTVRVAYKGYFLSGEVFDESSASGVTFNLANVIEGWRLGIPYFREGGKGKLFIPSALGYGPNGNSSIPPNSVLIFDIHLLEVL